jgi:hypothetical protein
MRALSTVPEDLITCNDIDDAEIQANKGVVL